MSEQNYETLGEIETEDGIVRDDVEYRLAAILKDLTANPSDKSRQIAIKISVEPVRDDAGKAVSAMFSAVVDMNLPKPVDASKTLEPVQMFMSGGKFITVASQGDMLNGDQ